MPGKQDMMEAIRAGLNSLPLTVEDSGRDWTRAIKTMLCELGQKFGYQVRASGIDSGYREWLYDVTWLEYSRYDRLIDAHLVAECEWGDFASVKHDFEKLLLARASIRLMIYGHFKDSGAEGIAARLTEYIRGFKGFHAEDAWLLAAWERHAHTGTWSFRYFPIGRFTAQQELF